MAPKHAESAARTAFVAYRAARSLVSATQTASGLLAWRTAGILFVRRSCSLRRLMAGSPRRISRQGIMRAACRHWVPQATDGKLRRPPSRPVATLRPHAFMLRLLGLGVACTGAACWGAPQQEIRWWLAVDEATSTTVVRPDEGDFKGHIRMTRDLYISSDTEAMYQFTGQPLMVDVDSRGDIYVLDTGRKNVRVFSWEGRFLRAFGARGQGPGELVSPVSLLVDGDSAIVTDSVTNRLTRWSASGELIASARFEGMPFLQLLGSTERGTLIGVYFSTTSDGARGLTLAEISSSGDLLGRMLEMKRHVFPRLPPGAPIMEVRRKLPNPAHSYQYLPPDRVVVTSGSEFQVGAIATTGAVRWASAVLADRMKLSAEASDEVLGIIRNAVPGFQPDSATWPTHHPAYSRVSVDGNGHVFAIRHIAEAETLDDVPVDVFDQSGGFVGSATIKNLRWLHSYGDFVFASTLDPESLEYGIARYRLELPW